MTRLFGFSHQAINLPNPPYVLDLSQLRPNEYIQLRYDTNGKLVGLQKLQLLARAGTAKAETDIFPGEIGRVTYQGKSWRAYCEGEAYILKNRTALVLGQDNLTLIVTAEA